MSENTIIIAMPEMTLPFQQAEEVQVNQAPPSRSASDLPPLPTVLKPSSDVTSEDFLKYGVTLYHAALDGDWDSVQEIWRVAPEWIGTRITKGGETVLHIAAAAKHLHLVRGLVSIVDADYLAVANKLGNTALCFAAVSGIVDIAKAMVENNAALPNMRGSQGMFPLHMVALLGHRNMVDYLISVTDDDQLNDQDLMGLLTSSIDTDLFEIALQILHKHQHLAVLRDAKKETALHALARKPLKCNGDQLSMWQNFKLQWCNITHQHKSKEPKILLELTQSLWKEVIMKQKPEDISKLIGYPWRLLFVATKLGKVEFLTVLIRSYPDLIWKVDEHRRSIFHIAVIHRHEEIFKLIYEIGAIRDLVATYKDDAENNMLHLASSLAPPNRLNSVSGAALQLQREILWFEAVKKIVRPEYTEAENKDGKTPQTLFTEEHENLRIKGEEWMKKTAESCALVATLIATMVFSAAFQLPGGVDDKGNPVLVKRASFVAFAVSNAISLFTSTASILMFLSILTSRYAERDFRVSLPLKLMRGLILLLVSIATMIIAFTSTLFILFHEGMTWVRVPIVVIACVPVTLFAFQQFPLLADIYDSIYGSQLIFETTKQRLFQVSSKHDTTTISSSRSSTPNTSAFSAFNSMLSFTDPVEATVVEQLSRHLSSHRPTASDPFPRRLPQNPSLHRPTASRIVDPSASEQNTPNLPP